MRILDSMNTVYEAGYTTRLDDAAAMARKAASRGFQTVAAVGGDGTINRVLNGLMEAGRPEIQFGVLYAGTSPDFCRFHGVPVTPEGAAKVLTGGESRPTDICKIVYQDKSGDRVTSHFACSANMGLGPAIAEWSNGHRRFLGDTCGTMAALALSIIRGRRFSGRLVLDGRESQLDGVWNLTIGKNPYLASGLKLNVPIVPRDGLLYVFSVHGVNRSGLIRALPKAYTGAISDDRRFTLLTGTSASFFPTEEAVPFEFDGDPVGLAPIQVELLQGAVQMVGGGR